MGKDNNLPTSFVGKSGMFYVLRNEGLSTPYIAPKYAAYSSVDSYNNRSETPNYIDFSQAIADFHQAVHIYLESLTTTPPVYPADRDESDYGLTPERNFWLNRFQKAREGQTHVA